MKNIFKNLIYITFPTVLITFLIFELIFRFFIPASNPPIPKFYQNSGTYKFDTIHKNGIYTHGKFSDLKASWHINKQGWNFYDDYSNVIHKPLIAIIGDSYVEALQVNVTENFSYKLKEKLDDRFNVFAFGRSGSPMSQYLYINKIVNSEYSPDVVVINFVHNDFDESLDTLYNRHFSKLKYNKMFDSFDEIAPSNIDLGKSRLSYLTHSALFRYIFYNLDLYTKLFSLNTKKNTKYESNIDYEYVFSQKNDIKKATEYVLLNLKKLNNGKRLILVMDGARESIYSGKPSNVIWLNKMMKELTDKYKIEFIDLDQYMRRDFNQNHVKFNSNIDFHWNQYGHNFVSEILYKQIKK